MECGFKIKIQIHHWKEREKYHENDAADVRWGKQIAKYSRMFVHSFS